MRKFIAIVAFFMISTNVFAEAFSGTYKTMPSKKTGGWAYVKFGACKENKYLTCGTLMKAFSEDGKVINSANELALYLLEDAKVSLVPGEDFGAPNCIRISYAASENELIEATQRLEISLKKLS